jgi:hypothetical protein
MRKINKKSGSSVPPNLQNYLLAHWVESTTPFRKPIIEFTAPFQNPLGGKKMGGDLYQLGWQG